MKEKDFVKKPKNSGYQSLHVIVQFTDGKKVEIQLRTIGMDFWASVDHQLRYKKTIGADKDIELSKPNF